MLYHLDTGHRLEEGLSIGLNESRHSLFGLNYAEKFRRYGVSDALQSGNSKIPLEHLDPATFREFALEFFRLHNPSIKSINPPSRLCSFFATSSIEDAIRYAERHEHKEELRIFEIDVDGDFKRLDMTWLDRIFPKRIDANVSYYLSGYWRGAHFDKDPYLANADPRASLHEHLVTRPIKIGRRVV